MFGKSRLRKLGGQCDYYYSGYGSIRNDFMLYTLDEFEHGVLCALRKHKLDELLAAKKEDVK